jgi:hypothetical protein
MKNIIAAIIVSLFVGKVAADPASIIKQKAKDTANQNNAQQGQPPQYPSAQRPGASPAQPAAPLTVEQQLFLAVQNDLAAPKAEDADKLAADMMAMGLAISKSTATIQKLAKDLISALAGKSATAALRSRIVQGIRTVMNGGRQPDSKIDPYIADVSAILKVAGANPDAIAAVNADLKTLRAETVPPPAKSPDK